MDAVMINYNGLKSVEIVSGHSSIEIPVDGLDELVAKLIVARKHVRVNLKEEALRQLKKSDVADAVLLAKALSDDASSEAEQLTKMVHEYEEALASETPSEKKARNRSEHLSDET